MDDTAVNRSRITEKFNQFEDLNFCFIAVNGNDCQEQLKGLSLQIMPEVIFMDLEMPEMDGVQTIRMARALYPEIFLKV